MVVGWVIGLIIVILVLISIAMFNRVIVLYNRTENAWSQIDVQLKKRSDLVPNLINTVKGYAKHEKEIMNSVTKAHENMLKANTIEKKAEADNILTGALKSIFALAENYPNLKANENFRLFQEQIEGIENKIAYARQAYNDSVLDYDNYISTFPGVLFAKILGKRERPYFKIEESEKKKPVVDF